MRQVEVLNNREVIASAVRSIGTEHLAELIANLRDSDAGRFTTFREALWACTLSELPLPSPGRIDVEPLIPGIDGLLGKTKDGRTWERTGFIEANTGRLRFGLSHLDDPGGLYNEMGPTGDTIAVLIQQARSGKRLSHITPDDLTAFLSKDTVKVYMVIAHSGTSAYLKTPRTPCFVSQEEVEKKIVALTGECLIPESKMGEFSKRACAELGICVYALDRTRGAGQLLLKEQG